MNNVAIIGLGYVGIHVALSFGKLIPTIGFDINKNRIKELQDNIDLNGEVSKTEIKNSRKLKLTSNDKDLRFANYFIVTVPTPIDKRNLPDLSATENVCKMLGKYLKKNDIIIFESTFYPGCTEEFCVPLLEKHSNLRYKYDFFCAYSPERINPGDKKHKLKDINKIVGASDRKTLLKVSRLYQKIIEPKIFKTSSIIVAESSKIIENTQRDLNIALMNELSIIFSKLKIDTQEVINAASTKWNFNKYYPGMVGGHCIGVDPYYLAYKSKKIGYDPKLILRGRSINENVPFFVFSKIKKLAQNKKLNLKKSKVLILGATFKKNCKDIRNSKVFNLIDLFSSRKISIKFFDPLISVKVKKYEKKQLLNLKNKYKFDIIILAVNHDYFVNIGINNILKYGSKNCIFFDINGSFKGLSSKNKL